MLKLFRSKPPLDEDSVNWLFEAFGWTLRHFDQKLFYGRTQLITPSNEHFPGRAENPQEMAGLIFTQIRTHALMTHWPFRMVEQNQCGNTPEISMNPPWRATEMTEATSSNPIEVPFDARQMAEPEALIASYAHLLAHHLGTQPRQIPPGGEENWGPATEILAIYMGFGVMFANSAFTFKRGGCGGCGSQPERMNSLSQYDTTYALALFCTLKEIPNRQLLPHLKKSLRPFFKRAMKDIAGRKDQLAKLRAIEPVIPQAIAPEPLSATS